MKSTVPTLLAAFVTAALATVASRAAPPTLPSYDALAAQSTALDLLYLGKSRPFWIRMHLRIDDKPFGGLWEQFLDGHFTFLDHDRNGKLDPLESARIVNATSVRQILLTGYPNLQNTQRVPFPQVDADGNEWVSRSEFAAFYQKQEVMRLAVQGMFDPDPYGASASSVIFTLLDKDADGKLTKEEAAAAEDWINGLDLDENEYISITEIAPGILTGGVQGRMTRSTIETPLYQLGSAVEPIKKLAQKLLDRYDKDKDFHLSRIEIGIDDDLFRRLDRDGTGKLDIPELNDWLRRGVPDASLKLSVQSPSLIASAQLLSARLEAVSTREVGAGRVLVRIDGQNWEFGAKAAVGTQSMAAQRNAYRRNLMQFFEQAASGKNVVDANAPNIGNNPTLKALVFYGDRDRDDKLTRAECEALLDVLQLLGNAGIGLTLVPQSQNWFSILDDNGDGRLSRLELRNAWTTLRTRLDITESTISKPSGPNGLQLIVHQGQRAFVNLGGRNYLNPAPPRAPDRGPTWFRRMDRNGDGFVSRREFLGTKADFDRFDRDADGLISADEAETVDKK